MKNAVDAFIGKADLLYARGCCDEAVALLTDSLQRNPTQADVVLRLAEFLVDSGLHSRALEILNRRLLDESNPRTLLLRGLCHEALGNISCAENLADQLLAQNCQLPDALSLKARIAVGAKKSDQADRLFQEAIACDPACGLAWYGLACLRRQQGDTTAYFDFARNAFLCSPASRDIAIAFHESSLTVQEFFQAEADLRHVLSGCRMNRRLRFFLIDFLLRQTKFAEAMTEIESAMVDFGVDKGMLAAALNLRTRLGPMTIPTDPKPFGSVSLCMIVKNEKSHLARCLRSAKPVVDEIIVADTGSSDETKDIALVFGAQVYDFPWVDDFSEARNYSLSKASGNWILVLDADETISEKDYEKFREFLETSQSRPAAYRIQTRNYSNQANTVGFRSNRGESPDEEGIGWFPSDKVRLFTNDPRIRFEYPVHELVEPCLERLKILVRECDVVVHHFGALSNVKTREKTRNYRNLGRKKLRKIKNASVLKEIAVQSARLGNHAEALDMWRRFIKLQPRSAEAYLNMGAACWNMARYKDAVSFSEKAFCMDPSLKEAGFNMAFSMLLMGRAGDAKTTLERLLEEEPDYPAAQFLMCVTHVCLGEPTHAEGVFQKLKILPIGNFIGESFLEISRRFLEACKSEYARRSLEAAIHFGCDSEEIRTLAENCKAAA